MKNKKLIFGLLAVGVVGLYMYKKYKRKSSGAMSSFSGDDNFFNFTKPTRSPNSITGKSKSCYILKENVNVGYVPYRLGSGDYIISTGSGSTLICPEIPRSSSSGVVL